MSRKLFADQLLKLPTDEFRICDILSRLDEYVVSTYPVEMDFDAEFERIRNFIIYFLKSTGNEEIDEGIIDYLTVSIFSTKGTLWLNNLDLSILNLDIQEEFVELKDQILTLHFNSLEFDDPGKVGDFLEETMDFLFYYKKIVFIVESIIRTLSIRTDDRSQFNVIPMKFLKFSTW